MPLNIQYDVSLQTYNSMSVPARAKCLIEVTSLSEAHNALDYARRNQLAIIVLGEGSNTLFTNDFDGLVILNRLLDKELISENDDVVTLKVGAGESWHDFVAYALKMNWYGLENLGLIPGSVGAAPMQNIGAYGAEVKDTLVSVDYLDISTGELHTLTNSECRFAYRDSIFKNDLAAKTLVTSVTFKLSKKANVNITYPALAALFDPQTKPSPQQVFEAVCRVRSLKLPMPNEVPNAGSFFKNPIVDPKTHAQLCEKHPKLVSYAVGDGFKLAAAWLIECAGWKAKELGGVRVHQKQALVIVNPNKCDGEAVLKFAKAIESDIYDKFGVTLEVEPRVYG